MPGRLPTPFLVLDESDPSLFGRRKEISNVSVEVEHTPFSRSKYTPDPIVMSPKNMMI
jgi:hypothetical protein